MSISIQDVLVIISTIRDQVNKYHSNNAICQVLIITILLLLS